MKDIVADSWELASQIAHETFANIDCFAFATHNSHGRHSERCCQLADRLAREITRLREAERRAVERCAGIFEKRAQIHAPQATWIGPERQYYKGARIPGVEMAAMNGEAISYDREMANAQAIRATARAPNFPPHEIEG